MGERSESHVVLSPAPRRPVQDIEAEMALLGSMIYENAQIGQILEIVDSSSMFALSKHGLIFDAIVRLDLSGQEIDLITLKADLVRNGDFSRISEDGERALQYLIALVETCPSPASGLQYASIVREKCAIRQIVQACTQVIRRTLEGGENLEAIRTTAEETLFSALQKAQKAKARSMVDLMHKVFNQIQDVHDRHQRMIGLETGYFEIDNLLCGLQKGQLYIVAGRPSMGKTSLGMNIAERVALDQEKSVLFYSLEMTAEQIAQQMLCSRARVDLHALRSGLMSEELFQQLILAAGRFSEARLFIDDSADLTALDLRTRSRRWKMAEKIDLVIVDYLQRLNARQGGRMPESRQVEISSISQQLKAMAKELDLPVLAMAQLNRAAEGREDRKPLLSDLRESGSIEQDADVVLLLFRQEYYDQNTPEKAIAEVNIAKNRTGPTGMVKLAFLKEYTRFENLSKCQ